jgi:hypothetical protein
MSFRPGNKNRVEAASKKVEELLGTHAGQCTRLRVWRRRGEGICNKLQAAQLRAEVSHKAVISQREKIKETDFELALLVKQRRRMDHRAEDEYDGISAEEAEQQREEKDDEIYDLFETLEEMQSLLKFHQSEHQEAEEECDALRFTHRCHEEYAKIHEKEMIHLDARIKTWKGFLEEYRKAAKQPYTTLDRKNKQNKAKLAALLAPDREQPLRESQSVASKSATPKTKTAAATTASPTLTRANPAAQAIGGLRPSRS